MLPHLPYNRMSLHICMRMNDDEYYEHQKQSDEGLGGSSRNVIAAMMLNYHSVPTLNTMQQLHEQC